MRDTNPASTPARPGDSAGFLGVMSTTIEITEEQIERVIRSEAEAACESIDVEEIYARHVKEVVAASVATLTDEAIREKIEVELDAIIAEGWQPTDRWGEPEGRRHSLRDRLTHALSDGFSTGKRNASDWLRRAYKDEVGKLAYEVKKELSEELREWRRKEILARVKQAVDGEILRR